MIILPGISSSDEQTMTDLVREQIASMSADAELLRAGGSAKAAERMAKGAARLRRRLERHKATREERAVKWQAQTLDGFVATLELMLGDAPNVTDLTLAIDDTATGASRTLYAPQVRDTPGERPSDAALPLIRSQCTDATDGEEQE